MLKLFLTCESYAGFGLRCVFIRFFCSSHFARFGQSFMPTADFDLSCTLGPRPCLCAEVSIMRTSMIFEVGCYTLHARSAAEARARIG
jgi:hypothetical protein